PGQGRFVSWAYQRSGTLLGLARLAEVLNTIPNGEQKVCTQIAPKSSSLSNEFVLNVLDHMTVGG
uniref:hypothetical protein n=1 Tax=Ralstonia pseudosolanacearum TaxID=1310165 RepID=UPI001FF92FAF